MQTESTIKSKTIPAHEIPEQFETLLGEIRNGMEIKISRDGIVIARMVPEAVAAKKASLPDFYGRAKAIFGKPSGRSLSKYLEESRKKQFLISVR